MGLENAGLNVGYLDELGQRDSPVHRLDARAKTIVTALFIVFVMSVPRYDVSALIPFALYPAALLTLGRIPLRALSGKLLVALPFALAVGGLNPFFDHRPVAALGPFALSGGWCSFASIGVRFVLTVSAALALVACTGMQRLCAGLERLGVPRVFAVQLLFLYRYLFVVVDEGARMLRSLRLRSAGAQPVRLRVYGLLVGQLLLRSLARAERVYGAMRARGFDGEIRILGSASPRWTDVAFVVGWTLFFVAARTWNLADGLGGLLMGGAR
jgi:cobalt/nickel transport system permease protein